TPAELEHFLADFAGRLSKNSASLSPRDELLHELLTTSSMDRKDLLAACEATQAALAERLRLAGYDSGHAFYVEMLAQRIDLFAYAFAGKDVVYRTTDYKSNEYEGLLGGELFER